MRSIFKKILYTMSFALLLFLIVTLLIPYLSFIFTGTIHAPRGKNTFKVVAHRGASGYAPENTLASFERGIAMGADMVELDVHLTSDDSVVVMHDHEVSRTTNGKGDIGAMTFAELRKLDAGSWFSEEFRGEQVPTLAEVLQLVNGRVKLLIELKWPAKGLYEGLVEKTVKVIRDHHAEAWVILQSFEITYLDEAAKIAPAIEQQQLIFGKSGLIPLYFERGPKLGSFVPQQAATSVNIFYLYVNQKLISDMHARGKTVFAFTPNNEKDMHKLLKLGIDGIITNFPDRALKASGR